MLFFIEGGHGSGLPRSISVLDVVENCQRHAGQSKEKNTNMIRTDHSSSTQTTYTITISYGTFCTYVYIFWSSYNIHFNRGWDSRSLLSSKILSRWDHFVTSYPFHMQTIWLSTFTLAPPCSYLATHPAYSYIPLEGGLQVGLADGAVISEDGGARVGFLDDYRWAVSPGDVGQAGTAVSLATSVGAGATYSGTINNRRYKQEIYDWTFASRLIRKAIVLHS